MDALTNWSPEQLENIITFYEAHKGEYFEVMHNALKELLTRFGIPVIEDKVCLIGKRSLRFIRFPVLRCFGPCLRLWVLGL